MTIHTLKGRDRGHVTHFRFWEPGLYLRKGWSYRCQSFYTGRLYQVL